MCVDKACGYKFNTLETPLPERFAPGKVMISEESVTILRDPTKSRHETHPKELRAQVVRESQFKSVKQLVEKYGVAENTVRYWLKVAKSRRK